MQVQLSRANSAYSPHEDHFSRNARQHLSAGKNYHVHAVSVYEGIVFLLVVDDLNTPVFLPRSVFQVVESDIPDDWIMNAFTDGPVQLVAGPSFIASDLESYQAMVDQRMRQVDLFWERSESMYGPSIA